MRRAGAGPYAAGDSQASLPPLRGKAIALSMSLCEWAGSSARGVDDANGSDVRHELLKTTFGRQPRTAPTCVEATLSLSGGPG